MNWRKALISLQVALFSCVLILISGCSSWFGGGKTDSPAASAPAGKKSVAKPSGPKVVEFKDGSSLTMGEIDFEIEKVLAANPYTKAMSASQLPPDMKEMFFKEMLSRKVVEMWADDNKVSDSEAFKEDLEQTIKLLVQAKKGEWFSNQVKAKAEKSVSDSDVQAAYDKNKSRYVKATGGVRVAAVRFASRDTAKEFFDSLDTSISKVQDFEEASKNAPEGKFRDFGRISEESPKGASKVLVDEAMSRRSFPSIEMVKSGDDEYWVAFFEDSKDAVHFGFDEVSSQIRSMIENEKFAEMIESEVKAIESKYVKTINSSVFRSAGGAPMGAAADDSGEA